MKKKLPIIISFLLVTQAATAQFYQQYFEGADTSVSNSLLIQLDPDSNNIWQIGPPQKTIFSSASTVPNVIVTDTVNYYPDSNVSVFRFKVPLWQSFGIVALQWNQKLDMEANHDGGKIEFSVDSGVTWQSAFNNPYVYNFYGYLTSNLYTLPSGDPVFSGTDTTWRNVWLCYDMNWLSNMIDTLDVRFTFSSDTSATNHEGWMIDNLFAQMTFQHTITEKKLDHYLNVYPSPASDLIYIETQKIQGFHIIENMQLIDVYGRLVEEWKNIPTKFFIDGRKYRNGTYYLKIKTNLKSETLPVVISHQ